MVFDDFIDPVRAHQVQIDTAETAADVEHVLARQIEPLRQSFERQFHCALTRIGAIEAGTGVTLCRADGTQQLLQARGYDHFQSSHTS